eukprot:scaffold4446_cov199-Alexandrium_tamarense.AAC.9
MRLRLKRPDNLEREIQLPRSMVNNIQYLPYEAVTHIWNVTQEGVHKQTYTRKFKEKMIRSWKMKEVKRGINEIGRYSESICIRRRDRRGMDD